MVKNPSGEGAQHRRSPRRYPRRVGESVDPDVGRVLVVSKTHLDVGFTDTAAGVSRRYLDEFFPRAIATAAELRAAGGQPRLRWTTGSWILTEALGAASGSDRRRIEEAVEHGDLCWHALPFTLHTEFADRSLVEQGLSLSARLDSRFGRRTVAAKMTDVPGHTRSLVPLLVDAGVELLHIGVNPVAAAPEVPRQFIWRDDRTDSEIVVMYQPGGYGDVQVVPGTGVAVAIDMTGDNLGPRSAAEVAAQFELLAARFPGAEVVAASFDDVARVMGSVRSALPVITAEIGDTWIHGVGSDPEKVAGFRALARQRRGWLRDAVVPVDDPGLGRASTRLLLVAEHTWGLDQKTHWPETSHWGAPELASVRTDEATRRFEASWAEQRALLDEYVSELASAGHEALADAAARELAAVTSRPARPTCDPLEPLEPGVAVELGGWRLRVGDDGTVERLDGAVAPLCSVGQQTFDAADYERWYSTYNASVTPDDEWWARWDNTKPGLECSGARSAWWGGELTGAWVGRDELGEVLVVEQRIACSPVDPVAVPSAYRTTIRASAVTGTAAAPGALELELAWWDRPAARWPGAVWWQLAPPVTDPFGWWMVKLGELVSPFDVVAGGATRLHVVDRIVHRDGTSIEPIDSGLVAPGPPRLLVWDDEPVSLDQGWYVCVHANLWGTNFPMWAEGDGRCRAVISRTAGLSDGVESV